MQLKKAGSGIPLIDKSLDGGLPRGSTILLYGPTHVPKGLIAAHILFERLKSGDVGVFVGTEESPQGLKSRWQKLGWDFEKFESSGYLKFLDAYTKSIGGECIDNDRVLYAENAQSINEICIAVAELNEVLWNINSDVINVYDSGSRTLMMSNPILSANRLISLTNKIKETGAIFLITFEEGMQSEELLTSIKHASDVVLEFKDVRDDGSDLMIRVSGKGVKNPSAWIPFDFKFKGLKK